VITPQFDSAWYFFNGMARIYSSTNNSYGYIDKKGNIVVQPQFYKASDFINGLAAVITYDNKMGWIDMNGNYVWQPSSIAKKSGKGNEIQSLNRIFDDYYKKTDKKIKAQGIKKISENMGVKGKGKKIIFILVIINKINKLYFYYYVKGKFGLKKIIK